MNKKNLTMLDNYHQLKDAQNEKYQKIDDRSSKPSKIFKVNKIPKNGSSNESPDGTSSEEQKNISSNTSGGYKVQNNCSNIDSNASTRTPSNYICLCNGKIIIKGTEIETTVPCNIETINGKVSMISPQYPVKICIYPLSLSTPQIYDPKSQSFTSKGSSSQSNGASYCNNGR